MVDDITDTGSTFLHAINYLNYTTNDTSVTTFALLEKKHAEFKVDYSGQNIDDDVWVKFPWIKNENWHCRQS